MRAQLRAAALAFADAVAVIIERQGGHAPRPFSQVDGERPSGAGRERYLRIWRLAHKNGDAGATEQGRARLLTSEAWTRWEAKLPSKAKAKLQLVSAPAESRADRVLRELGGRRA